ncbi:MAG: hypothetical protein K2K85_00245 [Clostridia bacterium]|nr:hypothetical protein [Clostridia bacterium]
MDWQKLNDEILYKVSRYLNFAERAIDAAQVDEVESCGVSRHRAVELLLANYLDLDDLAQRYYLPYMLKCLDKREYQSNEYYSNISFDYASNGEWELKKDFYAPYEIFVQDDFVYELQKVLPQLGYFEEEFQYPAVYQDGRLWMSVTPNEINTMKEPISRARGKTLTFGLGLGYFAYMCAIKGNVTSVTIVEKDRRVIQLFEQNILPQFGCKDKIRIICEDAFNYLDKMRDDEYDYVFVDIYHDAGDGVETYKKFKQRQGKFSNTQIDFWIEKTIKYYI